MGDRPYTINELDQIADRAGAESLNAVELPPRRDPSAPMRPMRLARLAATALLAVVLAIGIGERMLAPHEDVVVPVDAAPPSDVASAVSVAAPPIQTAVPSSTQRGSEVAQPAEIPSAADVDATAAVDPAWRSLVHVIPPAALPKTIGALRAACASSSPDLVAKCTAVAAAAVVRGSNEDYCVPANAPLEDLRDAMIANLGSWQKREGSWGVLQAARASIRGYYCPSDETDP